MKILNIKYMFLLIVIMSLSCEKTIDNEILRFYGDAYEDVGYSVAQAGNEYFITGQHTVITRADGRITGDIEKLVLIETDINGTEIIRNVTNTTQVSIGRKVITLEDGSSVVAGSIIDESKQMHVYIVMFAAGGEGYTDKIFHELNGNVYANDIVKTPGGYLVLATTDCERGSSDDTGNQSGKKDVLLLSLDDNLQLIRSIPYGFIGNDEGIALKPDRLGGYVVVGTTDRYADQSGTDVFILSVNEDISNVSARSGRFIELPGDQSAADCEVTNDGYLIAGNTVSGASRSGFAMKITGTIWGQEDFIDIKMNNSFSINAICNYKSNSFLMAGQYGSVTSGSMLIFVTDKLGNPVQGKTRIAGGTGNQVAYDVIADGEDIVAVGGNSYDNNSMITFLKFRF